MVKKSPFPLSVYTRNLLKRFPSETNKGVHRNLSRVGISIGLLFSLITRQVA